MLTRDRSAKHHPVANVSHNLGISRYVWLIVLCTTPNLYRHTRDDTLASVLTAATYVARHLHNEAMCAPTRSYTNKLSPSLANLMTAGNNLLS